MYSSLARSPTKLKCIHQRLSQLLTTKQFVKAAQAVFDTSRFFPTVEEFVSAVIGDAQTLALHEWEMCVKAAARNNREMLSGLSPGGQSALHLVGGLHKLGMATGEQLVWIKKEFVGVWKTTRAEVKSLPASNNSEPIQLEAVRELSQKMSFNGNGRWG